MLKACLTMLTWNMILGSIGKVVTSHAAVAKSILAEVALIYTMHEVLRGYCQGLLQLQAWVLTKWSPINSFFFTNFYFSSVFGIKDTLLSCNPSGLHSPTPRTGAVEGLGTAHEGGGCDLLIGSTVSDAVVRSWLWSTATKSSPLGCFSTLLQVVDT